MHIFGNHQNHTGFSSCIDHRISVSKISGYRFFYERMFFVGCSHLYG